MTRSWKLWALVFLTVLGVPPLHAQGTSERKAVASPSNRSQPVEKPVGPAGVRFESLRRPDPFLDPLLTRTKTEDPSEEETRGAQPAGIAGMYINQVVLMGTSFREGTYTAVFQGTDKRAYFLREGDRLWDGYLRKIESDSVVLVRETKLKSGKLLTQDVKKQLRTP